MAAAHSNLLPFLVGNPGKAFVKDLTWHIYDWADKVPSEYYAYKIFTEVSIREKKEGKTRLGLDRNKHYRFDAVFFVEPGYRSLNQGQCYTVGIELKNSKSDLLHDDKIEHYLGYTDFFFIGVPADLTNEALQRAGEKSCIGVVDIENGFIIKLPKRLSVPTENKLALIEQIMYTAIFSGMNTVSLKVDEVDIKSPDFIDERIVKHVVINTDITRDGRIEESSKVGSDQHRIGEIEEEEKAARKAAYEARERFRRQRAVEVAKKGVEIPDKAWEKLVSLPTQVQQTFFEIKENPGIKAHDLEGKLQVAEATAKRFVGELVRVDLIERRGSKKTGGYFIAEGNLDDYQLMPKCRNCMILERLQEAGFDISEYVPSSNG